MTLTPLDIIVVAVPFIIVVGMAMAMRRYTRSVADYLAASRCAGRYLITSAAGETNVGVMAMIMGLEVFSKTGFSLSFWTGFLTIVSFLIGMLGLLSYRMRETRALTFHQFFEVRYSKGVRIYASFLNVFSGVFNFGVQPAVGARFFVYFCGLPEQFALGGVQWPTFAVVMAILMAFSIFLTLSGGHISIMVTDSLEALISALFYVIIAFFIVATISVGQMHDVMVAGLPGKSFIDPFDISKQPDFDGWFVVLTLLLNVYHYRGGGQGFFTAAKSPHESRMANILMNWRGHNYTAMVVLISLAAFTVLHHPDFASHRDAIEAGIRGIGSDQLKTQMRMPMALGILFTPGIKGCFCAVALFGLLAGQGHQIHTYGTTFLQDVVLPLRKTAFTPSQHVWWLRGTSLGVALFALVFSLLFKPMDYLMMITKLIGSIYLGGVGCVVWGGLYWKRGTSAGAMASLILGSTLAVVLNLATQFWPSLVPHLSSLFGDGSVSAYLQSHADKCPLNGIQLSIIIALVSCTTYIVVSLFTCHEPFNMDAMLHRGAYRIEGDTEAQRPQHKSLLARLINITPQFTLADKFLAYATLTWTLSWKFLALGIVLWTLCVGHLSVNWWFHYTMISQVWVTLALGVIVTIWFTWGILRDMRELFRTLKVVVRNDADDGTVRDHRNADEQPTGFPVITGERK